MRQNRTQAQGCPGRPPAPRAPHRVATGAERSLVRATGLIAAFIVGEVIAAIIGDSLVLLADAGHTLTDLGALGASIWAARLADRPAGGVWTYGLKRAEILAAALNGLTLFGVAAVITAEAISRLIRPTAVTGALVVVVALIGAAVNLSASALLGRGDHASLNVRGALAHVVTDLYAFLAAAAAGLVIMISGWERADALASLVVVALVARASYGLLRDSGRILLQGAPEAVDLQMVRARLRAFPHVRDVHDLHAWTLTSGLYALSAHVVIEDECFATGTAPQILDDLQQCLARDFDLAHATVQLEPACHANHEEAIHE